MDQNVTPMLAKKLAKIMGSLGAVPKNGYNSFHKYEYVLEADLLKAVRGKLAENNIFVLFSVDDAQVQPIGEKGDYLTSVKTKLTFLDGETNEAFTVQGIGQGSDKGDKGGYKAITGAMKYAIMKNFLMETGDDPERDESVDERAATKTTRKKRTTKKNSSKSKKTETKETKKAKEAPEASEVLAAFFDRIDEAVEAGKDSDWYKTFMDFEGRDKSKQIPSPDEIAEWSSPIQIKFLKGVTEKMGKALKDGNEEDEDLGL